MLNLTAPAMLLSNGGGGVGDMLLAGNISGDLTKKLGKRERTTNWAFEEKRMLLELCKRDMIIIENKRLDADLTSLKNRAWKLIHHQFSKSFGKERNVNRLKEQWRRMKAYTRAEVCDYHQRLQSCGQEVADAKRPSPFTFEIWEFMQEAKKVCRSEAMEGMDYSRVRLAIESTIGPEGLDDSDEENSSWPNDNFAKTETEAKSDSNDTPSSTKRPFEVAFGEPNNGDMLNGGHHSTNNNNNQNHYHAPSVSSDDLPTNSLPNIVGTLEALEYLKRAARMAKASSVADEAAVGSSNQYPHLPVAGVAVDSQQIVEMQSREHAMRMEVLQLQLQTAQFDRDAAEINKMIALRNLSVLAAAATTVQSKTPMTETGHNNGAAA